MKGSMKKDFYKMCTPSHSMIQGAKEKRKEIWCFVKGPSGHHGEADLELLNKARHLADEHNYILTALNMGSGLLSSADELIAYGADQVLLVDNDLLDGNDSNIFSKAASVVIGRHKPEVLFVGADDFGRNFAPKLATRLGAGLTSDCTDLSIDENGLLLQTKPSCGGSIMVNMICAVARPQMSTVRSKIFLPPMFDATRKGHVFLEESKIFKEDIQTEIIYTESGNRNENRIEEAKFVVAGGNGFKTKEDFMLLYQLAALLGAVVGATRPIVSNGWIDEAHQIGQSGKTIAPSCYLAFGISGAIQHTVGVTAPELFVAVNQDEQAEIFSVADVGIVDDCVTVVKSMITQLKK
jgi:electron transfer flavoprotein alpha subunit